MTDHNPVRRRTEAELERRGSELDYLADFERLVIELSGRFVDIAGGRLDDEINAALAEIGRFADVDRSYLFQFSEDGTRVSNTHEWCGEGIDTALQRMQDVPVSRFHWSMDKHRRGETMHCSSLAELPPEAASEREELERQGVQSVVCVPLSCRGKVLGFAGFDAVRTRKRWRDDDLKVLKIVGEMIAGAIERERAAAALEGRLYVEQLVASISKRFISVPIPRLDAEISRALREIGEFTGVDRSYVFQLSDDRQRMSNTHEWCLPGVEPQIQHLQDHPVQPFRYSMQRMRRGRIFHVDRVTDLPPEAAREREEFEREGICTLLNVPIMARSRMIGFLGLDAVRAHKTWTNDDIRLLVLLAEIIANALERKQVEERLQASVHEKEVLLREIHHRVKNNMQLINGLLYIQARALDADSDAAAIEAFRQSRNRIKSMATVHERLYLSGDLGAIDFEDYLRTLLPELIRSYNTGRPVRADVQARGIRLSIDQAIPCGLILNELITNCLKYAFPGDSPGCIGVRLQELDGGMLELAVVDDGAGFPEDRRPRDSTTLGLRLVGDLARQLDGELRIESGPGVHVSVRFPRSRS
jgi:two-component sensor histidine kinase